MNENTPRTDTAPETTSAVRRIAFAAQHRPQVDSQGRPIGKRSQFNYDPETGRLVSVTTPRAEWDDDDDAA